jgi:hypothetical protein
MPSKYCKVNSCRFDNSHITKVHICGNCGVSGHGKMECGNPRLIAALSQDTTSISFDLQCNVLDCKNIASHTTSGHQCTYCKKYEHDASECPERLWEVKVENGTTFSQDKSGYKEKKYIQLQARKQMKWEEHKVYTKVYGGMGCTWYAKRANNWEPIKLFFMHGDNWGQYGESTDHRPRLEKFLEGYRCVDSE